MFFSYLGSNEAVTLLKFKLLTAVVKQLDVNWARLLVNLFIKEAAERPTRIKANMQLRHGTKLFIILQRTLTNRMWPVCTGFPEDKLVPHTCNQLIMILGILPHKINKARGAAKRLLTEMRDSKEDEDKSEDDSENEEEDSDYAEKVRKGKRKMTDLQSAPSQKRTTRSAAATFVEADPKPASPMQPAPPQVDVEPAGDKSTPGSPSKAQDQAPGSAALGSSSVAPPSSFNSSSAVDKMLSFFNAEFLKMSRKLNMLELENEMYVDEKVAALQAENAKLWEFIKAHIGEKKDAHGQFVVDKGQSS